MVSAKRSNKKEVQWAIKTEQYNMLDAYIRRKTLIAREQKDEIFVISYWQNVSIFVKMQKRLRNSCLVLNCLCWTLRQAETLTDRQTDRQTETERETDRQTNRQKNKRTERQRDVQRDRNFLWVFCPRQVKNLIRENSAKYVNQTGNFFFRPKLKTAVSLPIFNVFLWFLFYISDFIWIITLTEKSKFEENCRSAGIL